jgi:GntR family transcriptional regulator, transcriptional repressor for pyruvate dehydrogenase complex
LADKAPPVKVKRAFEAIVERIEQAIISGDLKTGDRLPGERELVTQFDVGRSSVREAMRVLESSGLVAARPGDPRGAVILAPTAAPLRKMMTRLTQASSTSLADLMIYRMTLESAANSLAASRRTADDLLQLEKAMARMRQAVRLGQQEFGQADLDFHDIVARSSGNTMIQVSGEAVRQSIEELITSSIRDSADDRQLMMRTISHHGDVFDAIRERDAHRAEHLARSSLFEYYGHLLHDEDRAALAALASFGTPAPPCE